MFIIREVEVVELAKIFLKGLIVRILELMSHMVSVQ